MLTAKLMGLLAIVPVTILLTISFFVLVTLRKNEAGALKVFGYVIAALLWVSAFMVLGTGLYTLSTGRCPMMVAMQQQMKAGMCPMMKGGMMPPMKEFPMGQGMMKGQESHVK